MLELTPERILLNLLMIAIDHREIAQGDRRTIPDLISVLASEFEAPEGTISMVERSLPRQYRASRDEALQLMRTWFPDAG